MGGKNKVQFLISLIKDGSREREKGKKIKTITYKFKNVQGNLFSLQKPLHSTSKGSSTNRALNLWNT